MKTISKKVEDLVAGNRVDLESCPFLSNHPSAASEYAYVSLVTKETPDCVLVGFEGLDQVGYPAGTVLQVRAPKDVPDLAARVQLVAQGGDWAEWFISQNLTTRDGDINYHNEENKPLELLTDDEPLFSRLLSQMWSGSTFVARKDGKFGILFEAEYCSRESESAVQGTEPDSFAKLKPHADVVKALLDGMMPLCAQFPGVLFAVPDPCEVINDRPAAWAFVADGLLTDEQRDALGEALSTL